MKYHEPELSDAWNCTLYFQYISSKSSVVSTIFAQRMTSTVESSTFMTSVIRTGDFTLASHSHILMSPGYVIFVLRWHVSSRLA